MPDLQGELNRLAETTNLDSAGAANVWAGTTGLELVGALNVKAGTWGVGFNRVCNLIAGTEGLEGLAALRQSGAVAADPSVAQRAMNANAGVTLSQSDIAVPWSTMAVENALFNPTLCEIDETLSQVVVGGVVSQWPRQTETDADGSWSERMTDGTFSGAKMVWSDEAFEIKMTGAAESVGTYRQSGADEDTVGPMHASGAGGMFQYFSTIGGVALSSLVGQQVSFECDIKITAIGGDTVLADPRLRFYAEDSGTQNIQWATVTVGEAVGDDIAASLTLAGGGTALRTDNGGLNTWQRLRVTGIIPAGTVRARILPEARMYLSGHTFTNAPTVTFRTRRARVCLGADASWVAPTTQASSTLLMAVGVRGSTASVIEDPAGWTLAQTVTNTAGNGATLKVYKIEDNSTPRSGLERVTLTGNVEAAMALIEVADGGEATVAATHNNGNATSTTQRTGASASLAAMTSLVGFVTFAQNGTETPTSTQDSTANRISQHPTAGSRLTLRRYDLTTDSGTPEFTQTTGGAVSYAGCLIAVPGA